MALDEPDAEEESMHVNGIDVLVSERVRDLVDTTTIDYIKQSDGEGFVMIGQEDNCC